MTKVHINRLGIILGTKCNLQCGHCLGGNPKKQMVIQEQYIDDLSTNLTGIDELAFIGFEDTLYIPEMQMVFGKILQAGIKVNRFDVFTNAVKYSPELVEFVKHYKNYVTYPNKVMLHLSEDKFHYNNGFTLEKWNENVQKYIAELKLDNYQIQRFNNDIPQCGANTLCIQGRAKRLNYEQLQGVMKIDIPITDQTNQYIAFRETCEGSQNTCNNGQCICNCIVDPIILTPNGYVFNHDGMAFNAIDTGDFIQAIGHISNMSLYDMVQSTNDRFDDSKNRTLSVVFRDESSTTWCTQKLLYDYLQNIRKIFQSVNNSQYFDYLKIKDKIGNDISTLTEQISANADRQENEYANQLFKIIKLDFDTLCGVTDFCFLPLLRRLFVKQLELYHSSSPFRRDTFLGVVGINYDLFIDLWQCYYKCDYENYKKIALKISEKHSP